MENLINNFMSQDHDRLDDIFKEFVRKRKKKLSQAKQLFSQFKTGLERHIVWEEEILFPLFESKTGMFNMGPTVVMRTEHKKIKQYLTKIINKINNNNFDTIKLEKQLMEILIDHNGKEEMLLYPWFDNSIDKKEVKKTLLKIKKISKII